LLLKVLAASGAERPSMGQWINAKISQPSTTIGRGDVAGRSWLRPADSSRKSSGIDISGSRSHNSESSGEEDGNGGGSGIPRGSGSSGDA